MIKSTEIRIANKYWLEMGISKRFAVGFSIDKYNISLDFLCFWITVER